MSSGVIAVRTLSDGFQLLRVDVGKSPMWLINGYSKRTRRLFKMVRHEISNRGHFAISYVFPESISISTSAAGCGLPLAL
jgi:hypothetical protein